MITPVNIDTTAVAESNGEPTITVSMTGEDLIALHKFTEAAAMKMIQVHELICGKIGDEALTARLHEALEKTANILEGLENVIQAADDASPECPGCGQHHFHQTESPVNMSDDQLAEVVDLFAKQTGKE